MSPTPTPPVHCRSPRRLVWGSTLRPSPNFEGLGCREDYFEAHLCGSCSLRPAGSTPCLLPTPPRDDAVGTVFGAEPSNCTGGTLTRVEARFTGAPKFKHRPVSPFVSFPRGLLRCSTRKLLLWKAMKLFIQHNGEQSGPFTLAEVQARLREKSFSPNTDFARHEGVDV